MIRKETGRRTSTETIKAYLLGTGKLRGGEFLYLTLSPPECLHIKMGSCVSHFNVSFIVWTKSRDSVRKPQFLKRTESRSGSNRGPCAYQPSGVITSLTFFVKAEAEPRPCLSYDILHNDDHVYGPAAGSLAHRPDRHSVGPGSNPGWRSGRGRIFPLESTSITIYRTPKRTPRRHELNSGRHAGTN